jgi:class 3 adenylate cyclase/tetratricopeptide (TPR) repeat protein
MTSIRDWLERLDLGKYADRFEAEEIDLGVVCELGEDELSALGLPLGPRKKILRAIRDLQTSEAGAGSSDQPSSETRIHGPSPIDYTPSHLAEKILSAGRGLEGERKLVTVMFADITGSTELIRDLDAEDALLTLKPSIEAMMAAVHEHEGTVNRVQGDGIMALFGAPIAHEDHAVRACMAAFDICQRIRREESSGIRVRVGLHTGEVVVHAIHNDLTMEYEADGATVHLAARMEQIAEPGSVLLTADTYRQAQGFIAVEPRGPTPVKGLDEPIRTFVLKGAGAARSRWDAQVARGLTRFVGRESELAALNRALERSASKRGQLVSIVGEAGIGKSRLVHEFALAATRSGWTVRTTGTSSLGQSRAYRPISELFGTLFEVAADDPPETVERKVREGLIALDASLLPVLPALLSLFDLEVDDDEWRRLSPEMRRRRTIEAVRSVALRRSEFLQLLLVVEDLHWADTETLAVLDELVDSLPGARMMIVTTERPEHVDRWSDRSHCTRIRLEPFAGLTAEDLLEALLGSDRSVEPLKSLLIERAAGTPLFLEEMVHALVETGTLTGSVGDYSLVGDVEAIDLPGSVQSVVAARVDRLSRASKELLQVASVFGVEFSLPLLESALDELSSTMMEIITELERSELLYRVRARPDAEYAFKHALIQEVVYGSMLRGQRRRIHARLVEIIEKRHAERLSEHFETLAHHALASEHWDTALDYLQRAGDRASERCAYREAITLGETFVTTFEHASSDPERIAQAISVHLMLRSAYGATGESEHMTAQVLTALRLAEDLGDENKLAEIQLFRPSIVELAETATKELALFKRLRARARERGNTKLAFMLNITNSMFHVYSGDFESAVADSHELLHLALGEHRHMRFIATGTWSVLQHGILVNALIHLGRLAEASEHAREADTIASEIDRPFDLALAAWLNGLTAMARGDPVEALTHLQAGVATCDDSDMGIWLRPLLPPLSHALALSGRTDAAIAAIERTLACLTPGSTYFWQVWSFHHLGYAAVASGCAEKVAETMHEPVEVMRAREFTGLLPGLLCATALVDANVANQAEGDRLVEKVEEALTLAKRFDAKLDHAQALEAMGRLHGLLGNTASSRRYSEEASAELASLGIATQSG